jgi:8-oxo-dGTP pyrophosphatase MutT (NUDIX family)
VRPSARVILLDARDRVLLIRVEDDSIVNPARAHPPSFWVTVGGGLEGDETYEAGARREVFEETGISDVVLGPLLCRREVDLILRDEPVRAVEHYFAGWTAATDVTFDHLDDLEQGALLEHRWWSLDEITDPRRTDFIVPMRIADLVRDAIAVDRADIAR